MRTGLLSFTPLVSAPPQTRKRRRRRPSPARLARSSPSASGSVSCIQCSSLRTTPERSSDDPPPGGPALRRTTGYASSESRERRNWPSAVLSRRRPSASGDVRSGSVAVARHRAGATPPMVKLECGGVAGPRKIRNPKHEIRNKFEARNPESETPFPHRRDRRAAPAAILEPFGTFLISDFGFVSGFRISDFELFGPLARQRGEPRSLARSSSP